MKFPLVMKQTANHANLVMATYTKSKRKTAPDIWIAGKWAARTALALVNQATQSCVRSAKNARTSAQRANVRRARFALMKNARIRIS